MTTSELHHPLPCNVDRVASLCAVRLARRGCVDPPPSPLYPANRAVCGARADVAVWTPGQRDGPASAMRRDQCWCPSALNTPASNRERQQCARRSISCGCQLSSTGPRGLRRQKQCGVGPHRAARALHSTSGRQSLLPIGGCTSSCVVQTVETLKQISVAHIDRQAVRGKDGGVQRIMEQSEPTRTFVVKRGNCSLAKFRSAFDGQRHESRWESRDHLWLRPDECRRVQP